MNLPPRDPHLVVSTDGFWDPHATNGLRARLARSAMLSYQCERGFDSDGATCTVDLTIDLLHHLHALGEDPFLSLEKARGFLNWRRGEPLCKSLANRDRL